MGYKPKPWPIVANRHRTEAILTAAKVRDMAKQNVEYVYHNPDLVVANLKHMATLAQVIVDVLESAPSGEEEE